MHATEALRAEPPEAEALRRHCDQANTATLWRLALAAGAISIAAGLLFFALAEPLPMMLALGNAAALVLFYLRSEARALTRHLEVACAVFLLVELALALALAWRLDALILIAIAGLVFPVLALSFHFRRRTLVGVLAACSAVTITLWLWLLTGLWSAPRQLGGVLWPALGMVAFLSTGLSLAASRRRLFLDSWRRESSRDRERNRIQEEIEDARKIQLSMLPRSTPKLSWLDVASVSLPASEVGGDYYDFFELPAATGSGPEREARGLAVVIGDVAGHGLASGLLLSGLRSCLYLLRRELQTPAVVLTELDGMVRHTTDRRMLVTLACGFLDPERRRLVLSSAGHPPALHYSAASDLASEVTAPALPLGTRLKSHFGEVEAALDPGDVVLFYTDGLTETANSAGELYGVERLTRVMAEAGRRQRPAREIRNVVLSDLSNFKGDARRTDDVTLVAVRVI